MQIGLIVLSQAAVHVYSITAFKSEGWNIYELLLSNHSSSISAPQPGFSTHCWQILVNFCRFVLLEVRRCPPLACRSHQSLLTLQLVTPQRLLDGLISASCAVNSDDPSPEGGWGWDLRSLIRFKWDDWMLKFYLTEQEMKAVTEKHDKLEAVWKSNSLL